MASFVSDGARLTVTGRLSPKELDELLARGLELVARVSEDAGASDVTAVLDLAGALPESSMFIGVVAQIGMDARARSTTLLVRASGRAADWLVWAGLHKIVSLDLSCARPVQAAGLQRSGIGTA